LVAGASPGSKLKRAEELGVEIIDEKTLKGLMKMEKNTRAHAIISGRVQGVFFRWETKRAADGFGISGWVRNKRDGTVEAVFEGSEKNVASILDWCKKGPPIAKVERVEVSREAYTGEFDGFEITY
jgi:acylphosphatase